ncbi:hypothetical protein [Stenotrophomonas sp. GZD-301]|uniref:hypothetical protein n=1 Tax=Stenotrophomonas sp. GZD-301 TaxID=3404814 RepID=UPI003BB57E91
MAIEFCPLDAAWGNWADWAAVVVTAAAAIAVFCLTRAANRTVKASYELSKAIDASARTARRDEAMVVAIAIYPEVVVAVQRYRHVVDVLDREGDWLARHAVDEHIPQLMAAKAHPKLDEGMTRFHLLPQDLSILLTAALGKQKAAEEHAERYGVLPMSQQEIDAFRAEVLENARILARDFKHAEDILGAIFGIDPRN